MKIISQATFNTEDSNIDISKNKDLGLKVFKTFNPTFLIYDNGIHKSISLNEIIMIKSESNYSHIILENYKTIFTSRTIKHWTKEFNTPHLLRVHRTYLVNITKIKEVNRKLNTILLNENHTVNYSRTMKKFILKSFKNEELKEIV